VSYTFTLKIDEGSVYNGNAMTSTIDDWEDATVSTTITIGTPTCAHSNKQHTTKVDATCQAAGNIEYWYCSDCDKYFSDEACTTEISQAATVSPKLAHDYSGTDGTCVNGCNEKQPAYEVYYELYDSTGDNKLTDGDETNLYVFPGTTYMAKVYISANAEQELRYFDINLTYDPDQIENVTNNEDVKVYNSATITTSGAIRYYLYDRQSNDLTTNVPSTGGLQVAQFTFTVKSSVTNDTTLTLGFGTKNKVSKDSETTPTAATTTALQMAAKVITITWNGNGGKFGTADTTTTTVAYNGTPMAPSVAPTRNGYTQDGWLDAAKGNAVTLTEKTLTTNTEYFAKWNANNYTVTYDLDGGEGVASSAQYTIETNDILPTPTRAGYDFTGWKATTIDENGTNIDENEEFAKGASLNGKYGNVTLTAQWTAKTYIVTFELNNGTWGTATVADPYTYTIETTATLPEPTRSGYTFAGWKATTIAAGTGATNIEQDHVFAKNTSLNTYYGSVTLTAQWTVNANASWYTYDYAPSGHAMLIVSAVPGDDKNGVYVEVNGTETAMFYMEASDATNYISKIDAGALEGATGVYVYLLPYSTGDAVPTITIKKGSNTALVFDGIMNGDETTPDYNDASIVNEMVHQQNKGAWFTLDQLSIQRRLQADVNHDGTADAGDVSAIVDMIQGNAT
jgi:uncharacterized repeat protein (TIGR02543 family)